MKEIPREREEGDDDLAREIAAIGQHSIGRHVILASASPYRKKLLSDAGVEFRVMVSEVDESLQPKLTPESFAKSLALRKAQAVAARSNNALVIGADTICAMGSEIIGKPRDAEEAFEMISKACESGLQRVITGVAIIDSKDHHTISGTVTSLVEMRSAPAELIRAYVATGEPMGKCGALCIEGNHQFVKGYQGSYSNIMGLPLEWLIPHLVEMADR